MSDDDKELELLKKKRLEEMQKNLTFQKKNEETPSSEKKQPTPREYVLSKLGYRGQVVLQNAEYQYPNESKIVIEKLGELIASGEINEELDGGKLLLLFRSVGLNIRMETKINVEKDGKFVSLSDKLSNKTKGNETNLASKNDNSV